MITAKRSKLIGLKPASGLYRNARLMSPMGQNATSACRCGMSAPPPETDKRERWLCARSRRSRSLWTKPQTSSEKVKTFLPTSDALRAIAIEVLGYSNVGHLGSRHT
jgi:hypothetical protein